MTSRNSARPPSSRRRFILRLSAAILLSGACLSAALPDTVASEIDNHVADTLAAFGAPSVSVAVVKDGKLAYAKAFGKANLERTRAAGIETRYAVGSISKQFTAVCLLLAQEKGLLSLDDKVSKYFPELMRAREVTIRQLLSHTSGYEDYAPQDYIIPAWTKPTNARAIMNDWGKKPLNFDPGTRWQYSNTNYVIAGSILEKATGQSLMAFLDEHIFHPLGMTSAGDGPKTGFEDADAYTRFALGPARPVAREGAGWYFAAGELSMTPSDLAKWDIAVLQKQILSAASYEEFTREVKLKDGSSTHYALGLTLGETGGKPILSHGGEVSGFLASNIVFPGLNQAVIVLSNEDGVNMIGGISRDIIELLQAGDDPAVRNREQQIRSIVENLQQGRINRGLFTSDASAYFQGTALEDYRNSLAPLGKLKQLALQNEQLRGGMKHFSYRAHFERNTVSLNIYIQMDGKFEQFLVEEQF